MLYTIWYYPLFEIPTLVGSLPQDRIKIILDSNARILDLGSSALTTCPRAQYNTILFHFISSLFSSFCPFVHNMFDTADYSWSTVSSHPPIPFLHQSFNFSLLQYVHLINPSDKPFSHCVPVLPSIHPFIHPFIYLHLPSIHPLQSDHLLIHWHIF